MHRYHMKRGVSLVMSSQERAEIATESEVTFLVNNAHSLVHILFEWAPTSNFREPLPRWLKGVNDRYLETWLVKKYSWLLETPTPTTKPEAPKEEDFLSRRQFGHWSRKLRVIK